MDRVLAKTRNMLSCTRVHLTGALTLGVLCFKFLYVAHLTHRLFSCLSGISELCVIRSVDKTRQEAESWAFKPDSSGIRSSRWRYVKFDCRYFPWYFQVCQSHSALWEPWSHCSLGFSPWKMKTNHLAISVFSVYYYPVILPEHSGKMDPSGFFAVTPFIYL